MSVNHPIPRSPAELLSEWQLRADAVARVRAVTADSISVDQALADSIARLEAEADRYRLEFLWSLS